MSYCRSTPGLGNRTTLTDSDTCNSAIKKWIFLVKRLNKPSQRKIGYVLFLHPTSTLCNKPMLQAGSMQNVVTVIGLPWMRPWMCSKCQIII